MHHLYNGYTVPVSWYILHSIPWLLLLLLLHDFPLDLVDAPAHLVERVDQRRPDLPETGADVAPEADLHPVHVGVEPAVGARNYAVFLNQGRE